jgi:hypothetical protein
VAIELEAGWTPEPVWTFRKRKFLATNEIHTPDPPQSIAGGYTDSATPAPPLIIRPVKVTLRKTIGEDKCSLLKVIIRILKHVYK